MKLGGEVSLFPSNKWKNDLKDEMTSRCARGSLGLILKTISSPKKIFSSGRGCPGERWSHHPWRDLTNLSIWHFGTWFTGKPGSAGGMVRLYNLRGLFQPKLLWDSVTSCWFLGFYVSTFSHPDFSVGSVQSMSLPEGSPGAGDKTCLCQSYAAVPGCKHSTVCCCS